MKIWLIKQTTGLATSVNDIPPKKQPDKQISTDATTVNINTIESLDPAFTCIPGWNRPLPRPLPKGDDDGV